MSFVILVVLGLIAGTVGSLIGLGGGIVIVPSLSDVFKHSDAAVSGCDAAGCDWNFAFGHYFYGPFFNFGLY